jgi:hypothetical protein
MYVRKQSFRSHRFREISFFCTDLALTVGVIVGTQLYRRDCAIKSAHTKFTADLLCLLLGTLFWQAAPGNPSSIVGALFQSMLYNTIGAMTLVIRQFPNRSIFYKQQDANFFPTWTYVLGRSVASVPVAIIDAVIYGTKLNFLFLFG